MLVIHRLPEKVLDFILRVCVLEGLVVNFFTSYELHGGLLV